jgi:DNA-binding CsgD family transcriptional regulator
VKSDLNRIIAAIYDAALQPELWSAALAHAARYFDASRAILETPLRSTLAGGFVAVHNISQCDLAAYNAHFRSRNVWMDGHFKRHSGREGAFTGDMFASHDELVNSEFYSDYLRRQDAYHMCSSVIHGRSPNMDLVTITVTRGRRQRRFSEEHRRAIGHLAPHVQRALAIHDRLGSSAQVTGTMNPDALQFAASAVFLVNGSAKILQLSPSAERVVRDGSILTVQADHLTSARDNDSLVEAIRQVSQARTNGRFGRLLLLRGSVVPLLRAHALIVSADVLAPGAVLVFLGPLGATQYVRLSESLRALYGLTPAESRLCELLKEGHSLQTAAGLLSIRTSTVASQLKSIFLKTGLGRQADLVRALLDVAALTATSAFTDN